MSETDLMRRLQLARIGFSAAFKDADGTGQGLPITVENTKAWTADEVGGALAHQILLGAKENGGPVTSEATFKGMSVFAVERFSLMNHEDLDNAMDWVKGALFKACEETESSYADAKNKLSHSFSSVAATLKSTQERPMSSLGHIVDCLKNIEVPEDRLSHEETAALLEGFEVGVHTQSKIGQRVTINVRAPG